MIPLLKLFIIIHRCRTNVLFLVICCSILAVAIVLCNVIVITVLLRNSKFRNSPGIYRISLAFADLLVGLIVAPTFAYNTFLYFTENLELKSFQNRGESFFNNDTNNRSNLPISAEVFYVEFLQFSQPYISFVGFITAISLTVGIYTLTAAGVDRFVAVYRPFSYVNSSSSNRAKKITAAIWVVGALVSSFSLWIDDIKYDFTHPTLIVSKRQVAFFMYLIFMCSPFIILWIVTIATFVFYKIHLNSIKNLNTNIQQRKQFKSQMKLMTTLGIIVGVFSVCVAPTVVVVAMYFFENNFFFYEKYNFTGHSTANYFLSFEYIAMIFLLTNSLWNFFVYSMRTELFRTELKSLISELFCKCNFFTNN